MNKLSNPNSSDGFQKITKGQLENYNNWRVEQYANQKAAKTWWSVMVLVGIIGGAVMELMIPTKSSIFAVAGFVWMIFSLVMMKFSSLNRD